MKKMSLLAAICLGLPVASAFAATVSPVQIGGRSVNACQASDCSDTSISNTAAAFCSVTGQGTGASHWAVTAYQGPKETSIMTWTNGQFLVHNAYFTNWVIFTSITCT